MRTTLVKHPTNECVSTRGVEPLFLVLVAEHAVTALARSWIELETKRESLLHVLDEDANFGRHPAARGPHGKDGYCSFKRSEKTHNCIFSEFSSEEPCRRLGYR